MAACSSTSVQGREHQFLSATIQTGWFEPLVTFPCCGASFPPFMMLTLDATGAFSNLFRDGSKMIRTGS
jgi:hypothetical protein